MNKKLIVSLGMVTLVLAAVVGGTVAFFSDTETSTGNTFTAGEIDLKVDSQQHYNNAVCNIQGVWELEVGQTATVPQYPVLGNACGGTWIAKDLGAGVDKFFNFNDVKPGDSGENTISLNVVNNDAWVCAEVSGLASADVSQTEPETGAVLDTDDMTSGELDDTMLMTVWKDDGDNVLESGEQVLYTGKPVNKKFAVYDSSTGAPQVGGSTSYLGVKWELPSATGNEVQTDSMTADFSFNVEQARNNASFKCIPPVTVESGGLKYGPTGWGGWSCPANHKVVDGSLVVTGGDLATTYAWKPGATTGSVNYPNTPFGYTYGAGEEGYIGQNDNDSGETIVLSFLCTPN